MTSDRDEIDKKLRQHLGLFGAPSANQVEASRQRIRERLQSSDRTPVAPVEEAPGFRGARCSCRSPRPP